MHRSKTIAAAAFAVCAAVLTSGAVQAQGRPSTLAMSCGQAQGLVRSTGAIVLSTGAHTYDRFVANGSFCTPDEETIPTWAPTRDTRQCMVGYRCEPRRNWRFDR